MVDVQARKAAINKASSQVRTGGVFVRRSSATGVLRSSRSARVVSVVRSSGTVKDSAKKPL
jgi:hypothetical protein